MNFGLLATRSMVRRYFDFDNLATIDSGDFLLSLSCFYASALHIEPETSILIFTKLSKSEYLLTIDRIAKRPKLMKIHVRFFKIPKASPLLYKPSKSERNRFRNQFRGALQSRPADFFSILANFEIFINFGFQCSDLSNQDTDDSELFYGVRRSA